MKILLELIPLLIMLESSGDPAAFNKAENAAGILQITPIMITDVNIIIGHEEFSLEDRWNIDKSLEICVWYYTQYGTPEMSLEELACLWGAGPDGYLQMKEPKVMRYLEDFRKVKYRKTELQYRSNDNGQ